MLIHWPARGARRRASLVPLAAALRRSLPARVVDQHLPHRPRGYRQEVGPAFPVHGLRSGQLDVRLVDESRGVERLLAIPPPALSVRTDTEVLVHDLEQAIEGRCAAGSGGIQQPGHQSLAAVAHAGRPVEGMSHLGVTIRNRK